jgi:hypothetical protein
MVLLFLHNAKSNGNVYSLYTTGPALCISRWQLEISEMVLLWIAENEHISFLAK